VEGGKGERKVGGGRMGWDGKVRWKRGEEQRGLLSSYQELGLKRLPIIQHLLQLLSLIIHTHHSGIYTM
jgi:hypothetical protein